MKKLIVLIISFSFSLISYAQVLNKYSFKSEKYENNSLSYIVNDSIARDIKFSKFREWATLTFGDYKSIVQFEDKDNCKIIIKGVLPIKEIIEVNTELNYQITKYYPKLNFTLTFDGKEDKYRLKFDNMIIEMDKVNNTPLGDMKKKISLPVTEYILIPSDTNSFRLELSSVLSIMINSVSSAMRDIDDF